MITISLCMIVKNEESVLERCLKSVRSAVDEIIVIDTGSTDQTLAIAKQFTDKIYSLPWTDDFAAARNAAFEKATMDYQMWLDADDFVPDHELNKLILLKETLSDSDIVTMKYFTDFDEWDHPIGMTTRGRLFRRAKRYLWMDPVHEHIPLTGNIFFSDITICHKRSSHYDHSARNLNIYHKLAKSGNKMTPRQLYYFAKELNDHEQYDQAAFYFEKFLSGQSGSVIDFISSCYHLAGIYHKIGAEDKIMPILAKSFQYGSPPAEICCEIGYYYQRAENFTKAYSWFKIAADMDPSEFTGIMLLDYWGYIPNIECSICAYQLGDFESANRYNERAAQYKPDAPAVKNNRTFYSTLIS